MTVCDIQDVKLYEEGKITQTEAKSCWLIVDFLPIWTLIVVYNMVNDGGVVIILNNRDLLMSGSAGIWRPIWTIWRLFVRKFNSQMLNVVLKPRVLSFLNIFMGEIVLNAELKSTTSIMLKVFFF